MKLFATMRSLTEAHMEYICAEAYTGGAGELMPPLADSGGGDAPP